MAGQKVSHGGCLIGYRDRALTGSCLFIAIALCMALASSGCMEKGKKADGKVSNVKIQVVQKRSVRPFLDSIGSLRPNEEVVISSEVDGILRNMKVNEGAQVYPGMVLAQINDTDYRLGVLNAEAKYKQAEANLANLKSEHKRKDTLYKEKLVTMQQFDEICTRVTVAEQDCSRAKVAWDLAQEKLGKATVRSPIKGIVKEKKATVGDFIRASQPFLFIVQINPLKLSFAVSEKDVSSLKLGQDIRFTVDSYPGREFNGKLSTIYPTLDERTRTLKVEALVPNESMELKPGFFAKVRVYTSSTRDSVVIPSTALLYEGTKVRIFVREGSRAREKLIKVGEKYGEMVEVLEGLKGGETLIVVGQNDLTDGARTNVVK